MGGCPSHRAVPSARRLGTNLPLGADPAVAAEVAGRTKLAALPVSGSPLAPRVSRQVSSTPKSNIGQRAPQPVAEHALLFAVAFPPRPLKDDIFGRQICLFKIAHSELSGDGTTPNRATVRSRSHMESEPPTCRGVIAQETGTETGLKNLLRTLWLVRFRICDHPAPSRCSARGLSSS